MEDDDDTIAKRPDVFGLKLEEMSLEELHSYILNLKSEIGRAQKVISDKKNARGDADSIFK